MIESFSFGHMVVDGKTYTSDLIIFPDGHIQSSWWRKRGHRLTVDDIADLIATPPDTILIGTGVYGLMKPNRDLHDFLAAHHIRLITEPTKKAWRTYNKLAGQTRLGGCFHVGC
jgi:hypothetical protein